MRLLDSPIVYRCAMRLAGISASRRWFIAEVLALRPDDKLVDIGCGPGRLLENLPESCVYVGLDVSVPYIAAARRRYDGRGVFLAGEMSDWAQEPRVRDADVALCHGALHHMDDATATATLQFAHSILKPGGRFVFYEPAYLLRQSRWSAFMMEQDRGGHVRSERASKELVSRSFPNVRTNVVTNVNRLGYTCIIGEARIPASSHW